MLDTLVHKLPLPLGTNVGEVIESVSAGKILRHIMDDDCNNMVDDVIDNVLAYAMVAVAVVRKHKKRKN